MNRFLRQLLESGAFCMEEAGGDGAAAGGGSGSGTPAGGGQKVTVNDGTATSSSASASVPFAAGDTSKPPASADTAVLMGDFAKDAFFDKFKDGEGYNIQNLAKGYKELQGLVGQKLGIPAEDATPEAKAEFYKALGVPETADAYGFDKPPADLPAELKDHFDPEHGKKWNDIFKKNNIPAKVATELRNEFIKEQAEQMKGLTEDISKSETEFNKLADEMLGKDKDELLKKANIILTKHIPESLRADMAKSVPNTVLLALSKALISETKELTGEDNALGGQSGGNGETEQQLRERARELMKDPAYNNPFAKGKEEHDRLVKEVRSLYQRADQARLGTKK